MYRAKTVFNQTENQRAFIFVSLKVLNAEGDGPDEVSAKVDCFQARGLDFTFSDGALKVHSMSNRIRSGGRLS